VIPLKYTFRSLFARWMTTLMTVLGTGLVVFASVLSFGLADGMERALLISADPLDVVCLRKGALDEVSSSIDNATADRVRTIEGIAQSDSGEALVSPEYVVTLMKPRRGDEAGVTNVMVRGLLPVGWNLRPGFRIVEGREPRAGLNEALVSRQISERFQNTRLGEKFKVNNTELTIVGYFEANGCAAESEIWTDLRDLTVARKVPAVVSTVCLRARDATARAALINVLKEDEQFGLKALTEEDFFKEQLMSAQIVKGMAGFIAMFLIVGAMFAAANTMYAAVAGRTRDIGTLRALGFSRMSVLISFMLESVILCVFGGIVGCIAVIPLDGYSTGMANFQTFSEIAFAFQFGPSVCLQGILMALVMGLVGGLMPAIRALRLDVIQSLREV
jgi:putative ABC transport system permease protein